MNNKNLSLSPADTNSLYGEIKELIEQSRQQVAVTVNSALSMLYWQVGKCINDHILGYRRAGYGEQIVQTLSVQLSVEYGKGWSEKHLRHCLRAAETFPDRQIFYALSRELSWTHLRSFIYIDSPVKREFYIEICKLEKWSTRTLQDRINSMLFERTAISKKPELTIQNDLAKLKKERQLSPDLVFRDPYLLDFLGLKDTYSEKDLETAILVELQKFIIEIGSDFAFMARQKRIIIDNTDYYIDLLFFHRRLKCLVAIELKLEKFEAAHKGQMELYLRWLEKHEKMPDENLPVGLILCAAKNEEHIELMQLEKSNIKVAEFLTKLPEMKILEQKLQIAIEIARNRTKQTDEQKRIFPHRQ
ncbi:MAG: PDDEXK nuclease domain-containing protein [Ignavibacteriales bacterium]|nr:PDDEXK nuclease domain-containing protein [Melioribacteraceae bacterium]MCF8316522.1 PDDEXK nuclease domain-containing protein [Ignavibacteriales bacterium]MCF8437445.1 PDDEXK nuclease domain-containing protein [Ignavibacteriales bacterium]